MLRKTLTVLVLLLVFLLCLLIYVLDEETESLYALLVSDSTCSIHTVLVVLFSLLWAAFLTRWKTG
eukprot:COSAG02_NODE_13996_length_1323_cov_0.911765_1_plen_65_part_10